MLEKFWYGTGSHYFPEPGKIKVATCGICNARMTVRRNVLGPTCFAEAMAGRKHRHDSFWCPRQKEAWHERIHRLKMDVYHEAINRRDPIGLEKMKRAAKKEILNLLKAHAAR